MFVILKTERQKLNWRTHNRGNTMIIMQRLCINKWILQEYLGILTMAHRNDHIAGNTILMNGSMINSVSYKTASKICRS